MKKIKFTNLRMEASFLEGKYSLEICIESGFIDFTINIDLKKQDFEVIEKNSERATLLHAVFHHYFQLKETSLGLEEQRKYLDIILHSKKSEVEDFLTKIDLGNANGTISNMIRITCNKDQSLLRQGNWFNQ